MNVGIILDVRVHSMKKRTKINIEKHLRDMAHELQDYWILGYKTNASSVEVIHS